MLLRSFLFVLLLACGTSVSAQLGGVQLDATASRLDIAPGLEGRLVFFVPVSGHLSAFANGRFASDPSRFDEYVFEPDVLSDCGVPTVRTSFSSALIEFPTRQFAAGTLVRCAYRVTRAPTSRHDLAFTLCAASESPTCDQQVVIGTRPELALSVEPTLTSEDLLRLRVTNASAKDVTGAIVATACTEFDGFIAPAFFDVVGDFPGGCPVAPRDAAGCLNFTGTNFDSRSFLVGPIPAGGSASCLVRLVPANGRPVQQGTLPVELYGIEGTRFGVRATFADGSVGFDASAANNSGSLGLQLQPVGIPATAPTALALLVFALLVLGVSRVALTPP